MPRPKLVKTSDRNNIRTSNLHLELCRVQPKTFNQTRTFSEFSKGQNLLLIGSAGTGKTFISIYLAMKEILEKRTYSKLVIIRNAQSSKDIGFLPGDESRKLEVYEPAYRAIFNELFGRADAYDLLKQKGLVEFTSTSFLRGLTIDNSIVIVDEVQNQKYSELRTVITRLGENSKIVLCGDTKQDDLTSKRYSEVSGLPEMMKVLSEMDSVSKIEFGINDIMRSGFVREFIVAEQHAI